MIGNVKKIWWKVEFCDCWWQGDCSSTRRKRNLEWCGIIKVNSLGLSNNIASPYIQRKSVATGVLVNSKLIQYGINQWQSGEAREGYRHWRLEVINICTRKEISAKGNIVMIGSEWVLTVTKPFQCGNKQRQATMYLASPSSCAFPSLPAHVLGLFLPIYGGVYGGVVITNSDCIKY